MSQSLSKQIERLVDIGQKDYGQAQDVKLFTRMMLQTVIPRKQTEKKEIIIRNGHWQIGIQSGIGEKLPSGSLPRLILILTIALAIEHNSRTVPLGSVGGVPSPQDPRELVTNRGEERVRAPVTATKEPGRNDPCPCGSGKKYKKCHGRG